MKPLGRPCVLREPRTPSGRRRVDGGRVRGKLVFHAGSTWRWTPTRIGTVLELARHLAFRVIEGTGRKVRICVQAPMGEGIFRSTSIR